MTEQQQQQQQQRHPCLMFAFALRSIPSFSVPRTIRFPITLTNPNFDNLKMNLT
jgi:hypothetical protein